MNPTKAILLTYASLLLTFKLTSIEHYNSDYFTRATILLSMASGACSALYKNPKFSVKKPKTNLQESLIAFLFLTTLLTAPFILGELFSSYPGMSFAFDFIFFYPIALLITPYYLSMQEELTGQKSFYFKAFIFLQRREKISKDETIQFILAWVVKIIFIPLMYFWLTTTTNYLLRFEWEMSPEKIFAGLFILGLSIDLMIGTSGYILSSKLFQSEVISTDTHWLGWLSCLICYPPLLHILQLASAQTDSVTWSTYFNKSQTTYWIWAAILSLSWILYWISTINFGIKFSNLSWRGLTDTGLYKYTKHPAYISKNIYWWMYTIPFLGTDNWIDTLRNILGMITLSLAYYLRAKTEERHLMQFPEYRAYSEKIEKHGIIALARKFIKEKTN